MTRPTTDAAAFTPGARLQDEDGNPYTIIAHTPDDIFELTPAAGPAWAHLFLGSDDLRTWTHVPREEVTRMTDEPTRPTAAARRVPPTPPRMSKAEWSRRDRTTVTLTRGELEQLAQLVRSGHAMLNDGRAISPKLRAAMTRLGMSTHGL